MDRINALGRGTQVMLVAAILLFVSLFFPWQDIQGAGVVEWNGWRGFLGVLLGILTILLIAWIVLRIAAPQVLRLPFSEALASAALGGLLVFIALLKLLSIISDDATAWAFIGFVFAILVGVGAWMVVQAAGGLDTLKSELPSMSTATASPFEESPPASTTPPPAAPPEAAPQAAEPAPAPPVEPAPAEPAAEPAPDDPDRPRDV